MHAFKDSIFTKEREEERGRRITRETGPDVKRIVSPYFCSVTASNGSS